jgi:hypothetical protein
VCVVVCFEDRRFAVNSLKSLSDKELLNRLSKLVKQEHNLTLEILPHLIELENRNIYRSLGYSSMFVYCTDGLGYSESSANRRIYAARAIRKCAEAYEDLRKGQVNLATLALVWRHLTPELLEEIRGKTYRQVQAIASRFNPMIKHRDITRPVAVRKPIEVAGERQTAGAATIGSSGLSLAVAPESNPELGDISLRRGGKKLATNTLFDNSAPTRPETAVTIETVKMHHVSCLVNDAVMQMLERCKELLSGKHPCGIDYNTLINELAGEWLEKHDPVGRNKRREKRKKSGNSITPKESKTNNQKGPSRYINSATKDAV